MDGVGSRMFKYLDAPQRSPDWFAVRRGRVTASRLTDWLATSKKDGSPLKARLDYERELMFERQFGVSYNNFVTAAMQDGIILEGFVREMLAQSDLLGREVREVGCWYSDEFVSSPDGMVEGGEELVEIKVLRDNSFSEVLQNGVLPAHMLQIQGGLLASGKSKAYYAAFNLTTKAIKLIEVERDEELIKQIEESLTIQLSVDKFDENGLHFVAHRSVEIPEIQEGDNIWTE